jgi:tetratricopeptide (TPR) repeat protein
VAHDRRALERALKDAQARLRNHPGSAELLFARARLLDQLGRTDEARLGYVETLGRDASHFAALNNLGMLLFKAGLRADAFTCFNAAVAKHPQNPLGHANLALVLLRGGEAQLAREHYEAALRLDPRNAEAHRGLALALAALGEDDAAQRHRDAGFGTQPLMQLPYRGAGTPRRLLLLVSAGPGNAPVDRFLDDRLFAVAKLVVEYYEPDMALPAHDAIFNGIGDADICADVLERAAAVIARSGAPAINPPAAVARTGRAGNADRLAGLEDVVAPRTAAFPRSYFAGDRAAEELMACGWRFPLLLRAKGFHTGMHFERVETPAELAAVAAALPGEELFAIEYVDLRGRDGNFRKYRVMFVGGEILPLHLAVSTSWKVHYFSADMAEFERHRAEEEAFLSDAASALGAPAIAALERVRDLLGLDYGGADVAVDAAGRLVVFEANATMIVPVPDDDPRWDYRRAPVARIERAVQRTIREKSETTRSRPA